MGKLHKPKDLFPKNLCKLTIDKSFIVCYNKDTKKERATAPKERKHAMPTNYIHTTTYSITVKSCNKLNMTVTFEHLDFNTVNEVYCSLCGYFREADIIDEQTGEVVTHTYIAEDFHAKEHSAIGAIYAALAYLM